MLSQEDQKKLRDVLSFYGVDEYQKQYKELLTKKTNFIDFSSVCYRIQITSKLNFDNEFIANLYRKNLNEGPYNLYKRPGFSHLVKNAFERIFDSQKYMTNEHGEEEKVDVENINIFSHPKLINLPVDLRQDLNQILFAYPFIGLVGNEFEKEELMNLLTSGIIEVVKVTTKNSINSIEEIELQINNKPKSIPVMNAFFISDVLEVKDITSNVIASLKENRLVNNTNFKNEQRIIKSKYSSQY